MDSSTPESTSNPGRWWLGGVLLVVALLALVGLSTVGVGGLRTLPKKEREGVYERTLENLRTVCREPVADGVRVFCREQAEIVVDLPECNDACRALASPHLPHPTR